MKGKGKVIGLILSVLTAAGILLSCVSLYIDKQTQGAISIIGGADGPTAIYIACKTGDSTSVYVVTVLMVIITAVYFIYRKRTGGGR